ncbi:MAG: ATP-dependent helicase [Phycisphaerae bacterium]
MDRSDAQPEAVLADLNEPQRRAVMHRDGPLLVLAGAGSGKTRVITRRAAYLVHTGVPARHILAITFTNKAADEMKKRIGALGVVGGMWVHTFHALGVRLLREFGPLARVRPGFTIYDEADQKRLVKEAMEICKISPQMVRPEAVQARISRAKNALKRPAEFAGNADFFDERMIGRVYEVYEQLLEQRNAVDFDDLLMRVAIVLRDHPEITERLNIRFRYVLIDEYQDTNHAQYLIARYLSQHHRNICATGDPDQSIYGWRGADIGNILEFERDYPDAVVVRLEQNYRSTGYILKAASKLIRCNRRRKHKDLWTQKGEGEAVSIWQFAEGHDEAEQIADTIVEWRQKGCSYNDFALMYRINAVSRGLEESLRHRGIPYKIARGVEFYNRKEIKDTLAYLRVLVNPTDQVALLRIINTPTRGIGKTTVTRLVKAADDSGRPLLEVLRDVTAVPTLKSAAESRVRKFVELVDELKTFAQGAVADAVSNVLALTGLETALREEREAGGEDRLANVEELVTAAKRYEDEIEQPSLEDFLQRVALTSDQDAVDESAGVVLLMTLHAAKGLEFPVVFIVGLEQGLLPHERALHEAKGDLEEERRLCFVGITRAQSRLYLSHARQRLLRGALLPRCQSQFLGELPDDAIVRTDFGDDSSESSKWDEDDDGFVPLDEHLPAERAPRRSRKRRSKRWREFDDEPVFSPDDPTGQALLSASASPYANWRPGTLVGHEHYGVGTVEWIRPGGGQTRASIRFARYGPKTFILEVAPVRKLERGSV